MAIPNSALSSISLSKEEKTSKQINADSSVHMITLRILSLSGGAVEYNSHLCRAVIPTNSQVFWIWH